MGAETIVVGAGSAGAVVAARATERSDREVLLLEAGPDYPNGSPPADLLDGTRNSISDHDWGYRHRATQGGPLFRFPRGKVVGGSSAVNTCIALRGQPYDYDEWAALDLPEWSWEKCLPAFKRLENDLDVRNEWHGTDGPIPIRRYEPSELVPFQAAFLEACATLGFPACADHNDPTTTGYGPQPMNKVAEVRMSAARCYLTAETRARQNFRLRPETVVRRVLFRHRRVIGVEVETRGEVEVLSARRVVLSGGAIGTPAILLRSGIGPKRELERLGIDVVMDLPAVGARFLDHPGAAIVLTPRGNACKPNGPLIQTTLRYRSESSALPNDMQLEPVSWMQIREPWPMFLLTAMVGKPRGFGRLHFRSARSDCRPQIESDFFLDAQDRARIAEAMELAWLCASAKPMRDVATFFWPSERVLASRAAIEEWVVRSCGSGYHPAGTVPMGREGDPKAALDMYGRVRGVEGLFVADASIMPTMPSPNTNLPTLMIGERFGEWLREGRLD